MNAFEVLLRVAGHTMPIVMTAWLVMGILTVFFNRQLISDDARDLEAAKELTKDAQGSNYEGKVVIRKALFDWAMAKPQSHLARWIFTAHNATVSGAMPEAGALTDAIWSQERERFQWFKFFGRYAILLGLFFTSIGLCVTMFEIRPALTASGLSEAEWLLGVKRAMAEALGGMATAFFSSLYGMFITIVLQVVNLVFLASHHERHVMALDAFVQGNLVPVFSALVEKDRNDVIVDAMNRAEEMFKESCKQIEGVREQYEKLFERSGEYTSTLRELRDSFSGSLSYFGQQIDDLGKHADKLGSVTGAFSQAADNMSQAIDTGLGRIHNTQTEVARHIEIQQREASAIVAGIEQTRERLEAGTTTQRQASDNLTATAQALAALQQAVGASSMEMQGLAALQKEVTVAMSELRQALSFNEEQLRREIEARRSALENLVEKMGTEAANSVQEPLRALLGDYLGQLNQYYNQRAEQATAEQTRFNQNMDRKWDQLLMALGAMGDVRA